MSKRRAIPIGAKPRGPCPVCHQGFRAMTDAMWENVWKEHLRLSERHKKYLAVTSRVANGKGFPQSPSAI